MSKSINIRKAVATTILAATMAASFGACGSTETVDAAASAAVVVSQTGSADDASATDAHAKEALADRGEAASRSLERTPIKTAKMVLVAEAAAAIEEAPELDHYRIANEGIDNGTLDKGDLCKLSWTNKSVVRCDAANAFEHLNEAFKAEFGHDIEINDSYRSFEKQVAVRRELGKIAAVPGYSNHGYGVALDLGSNIPDASSAEHQWMVANAGQFGWVNPDWAKTTKIEPWHWEFAGIAA